MPSKEEKERRKKIQQELNQAAIEEFERSLPMPVAMFKKLFDHLDHKLGSQECSHSLGSTEVFLQSAGVKEIADVKTWLAEHGGYCDCEVLANVGELFEE